MNLKLLTAPGRIDFCVRGELFTSYHYSGTSTAGQTPGFLLLYAAGLRPVTQPDPTSGRSLWFAPEQVNDTWFGNPPDDAAAVGAIVTRYMTVRRGTQSIGFLHELDWIASDESCLLQEERRIRVLPGPSEGAILDIALTLTAQAQDVTFAETETGFLLLRVTSALFPAGHGQLRNSAGDYGPEETNGHTADWCACTGVVQGETVGLAILEHPANTWRPIPWRTAPDGLLSPSPFLWQAECIPARRSISMRYRIMVHSGYAEAGWAQARLEEWVRDRGEY